MLEASRQRQMPVAEITGIGEKTAEKLAEAGITTLGDLLEKSAAELAEIEGIGEKSAEKILAAAREFEQARADQAANADPEEDDEGDEVTRPGGREPAEGEEPAATEGGEGTQEETAQETTVRE